MNKQLSENFALVYDSCGSESTSSGSFDYKAEYERILAENKKLQEECRWKNTERDAVFAELEATRRENDILEAQLSIVRLIFGGR